MSTDGLSSAANQAPQGTFEERLSVLEERTRIKPKTLTDRLKDWGGVASLIVALAYSFPLGLWDRFIEPEKQRMAREIAQLRTVVEDSTVMMMDGVQALSGVSDPTLYDLVQRSVNTRLFIMMSRHKESFLRRIEEFAPPEALVIGYNFLSTNQPEAALTFFQNAEVKAADDLITESEALRLQARTLFEPGPLQDQVAARDLFAKAATRLLQQRSYHTIGSYMALTSEWGLFELLDGDWVCGESQIREAQRIYEQYASLINDQGNFGRMIVQQTQNLSPRDDQPMQGC